MKLGHHNKDTSNDSVYVGWAAGRNNTANA